MLIRSVPRSAALRSVSAVVILSAAGLAIAATFVQPPPAAPSAPAPMQPVPTPPAALEAPTEAKPILEPDAGEALSAILKSLSADEQDYLQHVVALTDPFFEGRAPGLRGNQLAAEYFEFHFRNLIGLDPAFPTEEKLADGTELRTPWQTFRQPFRRGSETKATRKQLAFTFPSQAPDTNAAANTENIAPGDFTPMGLSANAEAEGEIVIAGYAIESGPNGFSSFPRSATKPKEGGDKADNSDQTDKSLEGKIALVFRFEPLNAQGQSLWQGDDERSFSAAAGLQQKIGAVVRRGAKGIIVVNPPGVDDPRAGRLDDLRFWQGGGGGGGGGGAASVPIVQLTERRADALLRRAGTTLAAQRAIADAGGQLVPLTGVKANLAVTLERAPIMTDNVAGVLRGRGNLADEYLIIGAHYDHLGYGYFGSRDANPQGKLHPGADDNASGSAGIIISARHLAERYSQLPSDANARSIIFIVFSGEESGLNGARAFIRRAPVPANKVVAMLNMDMIGRLRSGRLSIDGTGTAKQWNELLDKHLANPAHAGFAVKRGPSGRGPSDHAEFYGAQIPVLHFFTGLHREYHTPADLYPTVNFLGAVRVIKLVSDLSFDLATSAEPPTFTTTRARSTITDPDDGDTSPADSPPQRRPIIQPAVPSTPSALPAAEKPATPAPAAPAPSSTNANPNNDANAAPAAGPRSGRVRFGIAPGDYSGEEGVVVGDVYANTPAASAGLKEGDRMTAWNGKPLKSVEDWMPLLQAHQPGDKVEITFIRAGKEMKATCTLTARQSIPERPKD